MKIKAFTSDLHFSHKNIISYCNRPYYSIQHMNECLIENYNSLINKEDTVVFVGDLFFCNKNEAKQIMDSMNGRKILVRGNHDPGVQTTYYDLGFELVVDTWLNLEIENFPTRVCHYPYYVKPEDPTITIKNVSKRPIKIYGEILIHGHTHQTEKRKENMIHVGVDAHDYKPVLFEEVVELIKEYKIEIVKNAI